MISNESREWKESQETIYETSKEVTKEEKHSKLGALSRTRKTQMKYLATKKERWIFSVLKELGLKPIMIEKVRSVSCIIAKFFSFINHCLNFCQKLEVMEQNQNRWVKFCNSTSQKVHLSLFLTPIFFRKSFVVSRQCSSLNWKVINLVVSVQLKGGR